MLAIGLRRGAMASAVPAMTPGWPCLRANPAGCRLEVVVSPNAKRSAADGLHDGALRVRLAAPPVDGKANAQLLDWLAASLGCPKRALTLLRGETARRKQLQIDLPEARVAAWLAQLLAPAAAADVAVDTGA